MHKLLLILLLLVYSNTVISQEEGDYLFDNNFLHRIDLEATNLEDILIWPTTEYPLPVKMTVDGMEVDSIYLTRKGYTSNEHNNTNPPFKVNIDGFVQGKKFNGLDIFNLHNHLGDDYFQKNALSYNLYRRAGVPAPRTSFAELYINGNFVDIYTITEDIDKTFLKQNFTSQNGSLYKGVEFPPGGMIVKKGTAEAFNNYVDNITPQNWDEYADLHNFFRVIIVDHMISTDMGGQNDYMYFEPKSEKMHFITWDHNFSYDGAPTEIDINNILHPIIPFFTGPQQVSEFINYPPNRDLYLETACVLTSYLLDNDYIEALTDHNYTILNSNTQQVFIKEPADLVTYLSEARTKYLDALNELGYNNCNQLTPPVAINDIVINEFVADSDENGVQEPDGGTPDWIELYNNTGTDIILDNKYYISDNKSFQKKWHFEEPVTLPANGFLILWADKDVHQSGIHTNFNLNAGGEQLFMVYEDMTILQEIDYGQQELNKGYARVPNGTGNFIIQAHTFNAKNDNLVSESNPISNKINISQNPTLGIFQITGLDNVNKVEISIFNELGQKILMSKHSDIIDMSNYPNGIYVVHINTDNSLTTIKLLKF